MPLNAERWRAVIPHLDRALDLSEDERAAWMADLRARDPTLAAELEGLLARHVALSQDGFLERGPSAATVRSSLAGQRMGAYSLRSPIGQGGMGTVWLAERTDGRFEGVAAVKLLNASMVGRDGEDRFRREGSILARLRHPHIAQLIDAGVSPTGQPYLVLEHIDGERIDRYCDARSLGIDARIRLFLDVLAAVSHAHANLVVHRDLKPSNVLVDQAGQVKLLDFGIAKLIQSDSAGEATAVTGRGDTAMTPAYAAPEQLTGEDVTTATDVYSLGVLLYVLLAGRHPVAEDAGSPADIVRAILDTEPGRASDALRDERSTTVGTGTTLVAPTEVAARRATTPRKLRSALQGDLDNIVAKALKKRPSERYPSVAALADDLRHYQAHEPVTARADSLGYRAARFLRRHRLGAAAAALLVVSLAGGLAATAWQSARARREAARSQAVTEFLISLFELSSAARPASEQVTARQLLDEGTRRLDSELQDQPALRASLLAAMGRVHESLGLNASAEALLGRSEALLRQQHAGDDAELARVLTSLANVRIVQGDEARGAALAREALEMGRRIHGGDHVDVAASLQMLSGALIDQGPPEEVESLMQEALAMRRRLHGNAHPEVVQSLNRLGTFAYTRGDYPRAEAYYREALTIARSIPGDSFPAVPESMGNLGVALTREGQAAEAEALLEESVRLFEERLGGRHSGLSPFLRALGTALRTQRKLEEAMAVYERTLAIQIEAEGPEHPEVARTTFDMATVRWEQGRLDEAETHFRRSLELMTKGLPAGHPHLGRALTSLARVRLDQGDPVEAESLLRRAVSILEAGLAPGHDLTAVARAALGRALVLQRRSLPEAQDMLERAAADHRAKQGAADPMTAEIELALGECLLARGITAQARTLGERILPVLTRAYGEADPRVRRAQRLAAASSAANR